MITNIAPDLIEEQFGNFLPQTSRPLCLDIIAYIFRLGEIYLNSLPQDKLDEIKKNLESTDPEARQYGVSSMMGLFSRPVIGMLELLKRLDLPNDANSFSSILNRHDQKVSDFEGIFSKASDINFVNEVSLYFESIISKTSTENLFELFDDETKSTLGLDEKIAIEELFKPETIQLLFGFQIIPSILKLKAEEDQILKNSHDMNYFSIIKKLDPTVKKIIDQYSKLKVIVAASKPAGEIALEKYKRSSGGRGSGKEAIITGFRVWSLDRSSNHEYKSAKHAAREYAKLVSNENSELFDPELAKLVMQGEGTIDTITRKFSLHCTKKDIENPFKKKKV